MVELVMAFSLPPDLFDREMTTEPYSKGIRGSLERASADASWGGRPRCMSPYRIAMRQLDAHFRAALGAPNGPNRPPVRLDDPRGDRKAEPEAAGRALRPRPIGAVEAFEEDRKSV